MSNLQIEKIDRVGWRIISELTRDGRISLVELGRRVGLKHPSVKARIDRLVNAGLVRVQANINVFKLGFNAALINVEVEDLLTAGEWIENIVKCPKVVVAAIKGGKYNVMLVFIYKDTRELEAFIERRVRRAPGLKGLSVEPGTFLKPEHLPLAINLVSECRGCESCGMRSGMPGCPGCSLVNMIEAGAE